MEQKCLLCNSTNDNDFDHIVQTFVDSKCFDIYTPASESIRVGKTFEAVKRFLGLSLET
jgi:hypothetical protein